jgi:dihydrofolate synthase/folylpolyglutamate synthase
VSDEIYEALIDNNKSGEMFVYGRDWYIKEEEGHIIFTCAGKDMVLPAPALVGAHQVANAGAALECLDIIRSDFDIPEGALASGLQMVKWNGRLQMIETLPGVINGNCELWFDGGHNEAAGKALAQQARMWAENDSRELHLIIGMMNNKDPGLFLNELLAFAKTVTMINIDNGYQARELAAIATRIGSKYVFEADSLTSAIDGVCSSYQENSKRILVTGSLHMAECLKEVSL